MADKLTKTEVHYREAKSRSIRRCGTCTMFSHKGGIFGECSLVVGPISPTGDCDKYEAKK